MSAQRTGRRVVNARRIVQAAFLILFLALFMATRDPEGNGPHGPLSLFFDLDPLVLLATWLSTHAVAGLSLLALATVAATLLLGRVFCGWVCPLGTLHNMTASLRGRLRRVLPRTEGFSRWQRLKYWFLIALIAAALFGAHWIGVLDPFSLLYRSFATGVWPGLQWLVEEGGNAVYLADPHLGPAHLTALTEPVYRFARDHVFGPERHAFQGGSLIFLIFVLALAANLFRARFWCRYVCPLGALLGLCARRPVLRLENDAAVCNECGLCTKRCPAAAQPEQPGRWLPTECFGCWNCVAACKNDGVRFVAAAPWRRPAAGTVDLKRRASLAAAAAGLGGLVLMRLAPEAQGATYNPDLVRPPGALPEPEFLKRCIQCGMCMKACPTGALHPTWNEAGLEGVWTPRVVPKLGYCDYNCRLCGQVCPTGAIAPLTLDEKRKVKIGLAFFDTSRCLPYAYGRSCIVCEEHCPVPDKAITFVEREVPLRDGTTVVLKQPRVDPDRCTGCGICENVCPFEDRAAVRITSANESRHPRNQPLLPGGAPLESGAPADLPPAGGDPYGDPYGGG